MPKRVSGQAVQSSFNIAAGCVTASLASAATWMEEFRQNLAVIDVPPPVMHGDADRILPVAPACPS